MVWDTAHAESSAPRSKCNCPEAYQQKYGLEPTFVSHVLPDCVEEKKGGTG